MQELGELVAAAQRGDRVAFGAVVSRCRRMACAVAYDVAGDAGLAEDAAQEAFLEAYFALPNLREPAAFPGWFRRIVVKQADRLVRGKRLVAVPLDAAAGVAAPDPEPGAAVEQQELQSVVRAAVARLAPPEREATLLFYLAGASYQEIAATLEVPLSTVKKRLHDARRHLAAGSAGLQEYRPARHPAPDHHFSARVQLLIAVRTGDVRAVTALLARDPALAGTREVREDWAVLGGGAMYLPLGGGFTPLHWAATNGQLPLVRLLLGHRAPLEARATGGETPLHRAIVHRHHGVVDLLLAHGAAPDAATTVGMTALHYAAIRDDRTAAGLLLAAGAVVDPRDCADRTPLHWAAIRGHAALAALLLAHGASAQAQDAMGRSPADWAAARGHAALAALLADPSRPTG